MNSVNIIGNLTERVELKVTANGRKVARFTLAINEGKDKDGNEITNFPNIVAWEKTAELLELYTEKGSRVGVSGRLTTRKYDDKDGKKVYVTEVVAERIDLPAKPKDSSREAPKAKAPQQAASKAYYPNDLENNDDLPW